MNCCDLHRQFPEFASERCANRTGEAITIEVPSEVPSLEEQAASMYAEGRISSDCKITPCQPCDGYAKNSRCQCACHPKPPRCDWWAYATNESLASGLDRKPIDRMEAAYMEAAEYELHRRGKHNK